MVDSYSLLLRLADSIITPLGIISVLIVSIMPVYFIIKYKTIGALAYWDYATKKESLIMKIGYLGFLFSFILAIVSSVIRNIL